MGEGFIARPGRPRRSSLAHSQQGVRIFMIKWFFNLISPKWPVGAYRIMTIEQRRQEEEIKVQIWRKLKRRLNEQR